LKPWSKRRRDRLLALASFFDRLAARIRAKVKAHTPKRQLLGKPRLVKSA
jgi:hypothetical protein